MTKPSLHTDGVYQGMLLLNVVDSTNSWLLERMHLLDSGTIVIAAEQTAGRGRHGRQWQSPPGCNLYTSILLKPPFLRVDLALLPQIASLAIYDALRDVGVKGAWIKWPNDVFVEHAKIAGVLCESKLRAGKVDALVVGMGVNLNMSPEALAGIGQPATSVLRETGGGIDGLEMASRVYCYFNDGYRQTQQSGFEALYERWRDASRLVGQRVRLDQPSQSIHGRVTGLLPDGGLQVELADGEQRTFYHGEVSLRLAPEDSGSADGRG